MSFTRETSTARSGHFLLNAREAGVFVLEDDE